jgi:hypothetical protein
MPCTVMMTQHPSGNMPSVRLFDRPALMEWLDWALGLRLPISLRTMSTVTQELPSQISIYLATTDDTAMTMNTPV